MYIPESSARSRRTSNALSEARKQKTLVKSTREYKRESELQDLSYVLTDASWVRRPDIVVCERRDCRWCGLQHGFGSAELQSLWQLGESGQIYKMMIYMHTRKIGTDLPESSARIAIHSGINSVKVFTSIRPCYIYISERYKLDSHALCLAGSPLGWPSYLLSIVCACASVRAVCLCCVTRETGDTHNTRLFLWTDRRVAPAAVGRRRRCPRRGSISTVQPSFR